MPLIAWGLLEIGAMLAFALGLALYEAWGHTIGRFLQWLANVAISIPRITTVHPFGFAKSLDNQIRSSFGGLATSNQKALVYSLHLATSRVIWAGQDLEGLARDIHDRIERTSAASRAAIRAQIATDVMPRLRTLDREYKGIDQTVRDLETKIRKGGVVLTLQDWALLRRGIDRLNKDVARLKTEVHGITHTKSGVKTPAIPRVTHPARAWTDALTKPAAIAMTVTALGSLGLNKLRCPGFTNLLNKRGCGLGGLLDDLLGLFVDAIVLTNICRVLPWLEEGFATVAAPLIGTIAAAGAGLCSEGSAQSPELGVPQLSLPASAGTGLHLP
jgi:hypothetical protein